MEPNEFADEPDDNEEPLVEWSDEELARAKIYLAQSHPGLAVPLDPDEAALAGLYMETAIDPDDVYAAAAEGDIIF